MEFSTSSIELESSEIKPSASLQAYFKKLEIDVRELIVGRATQTPNCPACDNPSRSSSGTKFAISYTTCAECRTIFATQRVDQDTIDSFFAKSPSREFWLSEIWKPSEPVRLQKIIAPTIDWIQSHRPGKYSLAELNPAHPGLLQMWAGTILAVAPHMPQSYVPKSVRTLTENSTEQFDAVAMFDTLDRAQSPKQKLKWAFDHLKSGGFCFVTGVLSTGLDTLVLGAKANSLVPPDRFNALSYEGLAKLAKEVGFDVVEFSTPGALDVENLSRALATDSSPSEFLNYIFNIRKSETLKSDFQEFLQRNQLSSRARLALKKGP